MSNAKELKTLPVTEFPVELIGTLIERYKELIKESPAQRYHGKTIREVLAVFGIDPDN